jgi:hypothetical protein
MDGRRQALGGSNGKRDLRLNRRNVFSNSDDHVKNPDIGPGPIFNLD